jgi:hypothetical protein
VSYLQTAGLLETAVKHIGGKRRKIKTELNKTRKEQVEKETPQTQL